ncbi:MAG TPA: MFS transporter [Ilumatobacter sp.]|nr:MFS transporter [Ilumatobacter sp.]
MPASTSKFQRLAFTHAAMMGGEAAMVVALADSFFFDVDPAGARSKVLAFLLVSFAPFLIVAPAIGPTIDRVRGGRRLIVQIVAAARGGVQLLMIPFADNLGLFPLVFAALVLQKTYTVSKSALVPAVVRTDTELVEANSKLGVIAGVAGTVAVIPAGALQLTIGSSATLTYGAVLFGVALVGALRLPRELPPLAGTEDTATEQFDTASLQLAGAAMVLLRASVGFMLFHLAFVFRGQDGDSKVLLGVAVGLSSLGTLAGNALAPALRRWLREERMLLVSLGLPAAAGVLAAIFGGTAAGIAVAASANLAAAVGRLSFESLVQRDGPTTNRGQAFAMFETRFQLGWVIAAVVPVLFNLPARAGFALVGAVMASAVVNYSLGAPSARRDAKRSRGRSAVANASDPQTRRVDLARGRQRTGDSEHPVQF